MIRAVSVCTILGVALAACTTNTIIKKPGPGEGTVDRREAAPCAMGDLTQGIQAYDQTAEGGGAACDVGTVLDDDGAPATVGRPAAGTHTIAGKEVTGCIGVEFGEAIELSAVVMKMRPVSGGCGHQCREERGACGSGGTVVIFTGTSLDPEGAPLEFLQTMALTEKDFFEYSVSVRKDKKARFAVVCRDAAPETQDALAIDWIGGRCY